jgi:branched-chain amino acid transport system ATP-binding protein
MLRVESLAATYGRGQVLFDIRLEIPAGEVVTLLGRNGMGKTTTIRTIMGLLKPLHGRVEFDGQQIEGWAPERVARAGIGLVPEGRQVFPTLTVRENLVATAANRGKRPRPWSLARVYALLPRLHERHGQMASTLSGGEQQMLAIGRALMTNPGLLILDEATEGLAPLIRAEIWRCIEALKQDGHSILIVDKNLEMLKRLARYHYIIEKGRTVWSGTSQELAADPAIAQRYVGV